MDCTADCIEVYADGDNVALTPTADYNSTFTGWSGDTGCGSSVTMNNDMNCVATFSRINAMNIYEEGVFNRNDDAEEAVADGSIDIASSDLEMVMEDSEQIVGVRFRNLDIPSGAVVTNAYITFATDETNDEDTSLLIRGEDIDDALAFTTSNSDISSRTTTLASANWRNIPEWDAVGELHQTANLKDIVQEIIDRGGWSTGNNIAFIISGSGKRVASSVDGATAPVLHIDYEVTFMNIEFAGDGSGSVNIDPPDADCTANCVEICLAGDDVTLIATADYNSTFAGWSGDAGCGSSVTINSDMTCIATFNRVNPTLTVETTVSSNNDDAEEYIDSGTVVLDSSDLEMVEDSTSQAVGVRFSGVTVPPGVIVTNAYIVFTTDETNSDDTTLVIHGEDSGNAPTFTTANGNITSRTTTSASASWRNIPAWDAVGVQEQTANLKDVVQEIIDRGDWAGGNSMAFIITGSGKRVADSTDGGTAAVLHIEYEEPTGILYVANRTNLGSGDTVLYNRMTALGYTVTVVDDNVVQASDAIGKELVFISYSIDSNITVVRDMFLNSPVPVLVSENEIYINMGMAGGRGGQNGQKWIDMVDATSHPLSAGFSTGQLKAGDSNGSFNYATGLGSGAIPIAMIRNSNSRFTIFGYEAGAQMTTGNARARRVGFYTRNDNAANNMNGDGGTLFDAAVNWTAGN